MFVIVDLIWYNVYSSEKRIYHAYLEFDDGRTSNLMFPFKLQFQPDVLVMVFRTYC